MLCYRCGKTLADRAPRCESCGQVFQYAPRDGEGAPSEKAAPQDAPDGGATQLFGPFGRLRADVGSEKSASNAHSLASRDIAPATASASAAAANFLDDEGPTAVSRQVPPYLAPSGPEEESLSGDVLFGLVGKLLSNRLELIAVIGRGPLGTVYRAYDQKRKTQVAVKILPPHLLPTERDRARFEDAIETAKALNHPNIARVYGAGQQNGACFYIMPFLEGLPLRRLLSVKQEEGRPFSFEEAEPIIVQICQAIHFAHRSTIHGGLKPENIFLQVDSLKIFDLGISRAITPVRFREIQVEAGFGAYLAPEYSSKDPRVDRRADVYSLGVILYEMLAGQTPDASRTPATALNPSLPHVLDGVLGRALETDPAKRYKDVERFKTDVLRVLQGDIVGGELARRESTASASGDANIESEAPGADAENQELPTPGRKTSRDEPSFTPQRRRAPEGDEHDEADDGRANINEPDQTRISLSVSGSVDDVMATHVGHAPGDDPGATVVGAPGSDDWIDDEEERESTRHSMQRENTPVAGRRAAELAGGRRSRSETSVEPIFSSPRRTPRSSRGLVWAGVLAGLVVLAGWVALSGPDNGGLRAFWSSGGAGGTTANGAVLTCPEGMVAVAQGVVRMGSDSLDNDRDIIEQLLIPVDLPAYCIDRYEFPNEEGSLPNVKVTWSEAQSACESAGKRLCTESEWERACKGPRDVRYPYGDRYEAGRCNAGVSDEEGHPAQASASSSCKGPFEVFDLSGNVWEWTADTMEGEATSDRVVKGGSVVDMAWATRCAHRVAQSEATAGELLGFRCCKS